MDLAEGHLSALRYMDESSSGSGCNKCSEFNLGTGVGYSVMDMISAMGVGRLSISSFIIYTIYICKHFQKACGFDLPFKVGPRREGDVAVCFADCSKARQCLGWTAVRTLEDMCKGFRSILHAFSNLISTISSSCAPPRRRHLELAVAQPQRLQVKQSSPIQK